MEFAGIPTAAVKLSSIRQSKPPIQIPCSTVAIRSGPAGAGKKANDFAVFSRRNTAIHAPRARPSAACQGVFPVVHDKVAYEARQDDGPLSVFRDVRATRRHSNRPGCPLHNRGMWDRTASFCGRVAESSELWRVPLPDAPEPGLFTRCASESQMTAPSTSAAGRRPVRKRIYVVFAAFSVTAALLLIGAAELLLGIFAPRWRQLSERKHAEFDPLLGWVNQRSVDIPDAYGAGVRLTTNSCRFRGTSELDDAIPAGKIRIVCSGDSFTLGYGVGDAETYPRQLERSTRDSTW